MDIWLEILIDVVVALVTSFVTSIAMIKITSWLAKKSHTRYITIGKWRVGDGSVIKGGRLSCAMISLAKWVQSMPEEPQEPS